VTLLHPLALLGLAAAAIPALLHLLAHREPPEMTFPALRYLSEAERRSARRLRLRHVLLLLLRTAIIMLVVLAAARPLVPAPAGGAHEPTALVVILDNSPSSGAVLEGRVALDRLRTAARGSVLAAGSADRVWLMLADGVARAGARDELLALLDSLGPGSQRLDVATAVERAARLADAEPLPAREVHVFSDLQRTALDHGSPRVAAGVRVLVLRASGAGVPNRGVGSARVADGAVRLAIAGAAAAEPVTLTLRLAGTAREIGRTLARPGDELALPLPPLRAGWWVAEAQLDPDELRADDRRLFAWRVAPPAAVATEAGTGRFLGAALAVLREAGRVRAGTGVVIGERPGSGPSVVLPPQDAALLGQANRALAARGVTWRFGPPATPGVIVADDPVAIAGAAVTRRHRLVPAGPARGTVVATVNGDPWLVRQDDVVLLGSRFDTSWTELPATPAFVPFVDALVNRVARGETAVREVEGPVAVRFERRGADTIGVVVSGPDPRESDLTPAPPAVVRRVLAAELLDGAALGAARFAGARRAEAASLLLALALLLALVELAVAWRTR
jgi:hypothetical protein